ncbi:hypothetical protein C2E23DRAFT_493577 [Lenzites betulinus]|nr:hypothetical protein C2E23DRAFT_493577 [Lenzites betulinus]
MPSFRVALALVALVPAIICRANPISFSPAVALTPLSETHANATIVNPLSHSSPRRSYDSASLRACTDQGCTQNCVSTPLDDMPLNECTSLSTFGTGEPQSFASIYVDQPSRDGLAVTVMISSHTGVCSDMFKMPATMECIVSGSPMRTFELTAGQTLGPPA